MNYIILIVVFLFMSCAQKTSIDKISGASFGSKEHRIQFYEGKAKYMKFSPNVLGYDDISGATFKKISEESDVITYQGVNSEDIVVVKVVDNDTVTATLNENNMETFTPKGINLGKRPK